MPTTKTKSTDRTAPAGATAVPSSKPVWTSASEPVAAVDLVHLNKYTLGDRALEKEVLELFLGQLPETLATLETATTADAWRRAAHTLKGSSRGVGAFALADLAHRAEQFDVTSAAARRILPEIACAADAVQAFVVRHYGAQMPA